MPWTKHSDTGESTQAVPALEDMPSVDTVPVCECDVLTAGASSCSAPALVVARVQHLRAVKACEPIPVLLCGHHLRVAIAEANRLLRELVCPVCPACWAQIRCLHDSIPSVVVL